MWGSVGRGCGVVRRSRWSSVSGVPESPVLSLPSVSICWHLFVYSIAAPLDSPRGWAVWAAIGVALSPLVVGTIATALSMTG